MVNKLLEESKDTGLPPLNRSDWIMGQCIDAVFFTAFVQIIMAPNRGLPAYKLGLIKVNGEVIREPKTDEERRALNYVTRIALYMKRFLGARTRLLYVMYRQERRNPLFIRASARAVSMRYGRYFNVTKPQVDANVYSL